MMLIQQAGVFRVQTGINAAADEAPPGKLKLGLRNVDQKKKSGVL